MEANTSTEGTDLIIQAVAWLAERLPETWGVSRSNREMVGAGQGPAQSVDALIDIRASNGSTTLAVEAKQSFSPRDVERLLPQLTRVIRSLANNPPVLVVARG